MKCHSTDKITINFFTGALVCQSSVQT